MLRSIIRGVGVVILVTGTGVGAWWLNDRTGTTPHVVVRDWIEGIKGSYSVEHNVEVQMRDGVRLAANLYLPRNQEGHLGTVLIRLPYDKNHYWRAREAASLFAEHGFAVFVQDMRGRYASEGIFAPYSHTVEDGVDTLEWIAEQPWSNGRIGTFGCSALGESQHMLAKVEDPRHVAMITQGAGGAIGSALGRFDYFGIYEGGVLNLASTVGWFATQGQKTPGERHGPVELTPDALRGLPIIDLVKRQRTDSTDYEDFVTHPLGDPWWDKLGYLTDRDGSAIPTLAINTWEDQGLADTLAIAELSKQASIDRGHAVHHPVIIAPGNHCDISASNQEYRTPDQEYRIGDLEVSNGYQPYDEIYLAWFGHWLNQDTVDPPSLPPYLFFVLAENRWITSEHWPPRKAQEQTWFLTSNRGASSKSGDGRLVIDPPSPSSTKRFDEYRYDPLDPVPTRGGPICCTGNPDEVPGHVDQIDVEVRKDVLIYTSPPFRDGLRIVGPLQADLLVSSSAADTDFTAKLVDVYPDGTALNIQEGALRMRYRENPAKPELMVPGEVYRVTIEMRSIAYFLAPGHRMRLQISSSNFPRLSRNLNTGGPSAYESEAIVAENKVWLNGESSLTVYVYED